MNMSLGGLRELMDTEAWHVAAHGVSKSQTRLSDWTELNWTWLGLIQSVEDLKSKDWGFLKKFCLEAGTCKSCLSFQPTGLPCRFHPCRFPQLWVSFLKFLSLHVYTHTHFLLFLFLWRTLTNTNGSNFCCCYIKASFWHAKKCPGFGSRRYRFKLISAL